MPRYIIKLEKEEQSWYMEWSSVVDAPVTNGMSLHKFKDFYLKQWGKLAFEILESRLERVEERGTSCVLGTNLEQMIAGNRAGKEESELTIDEIIENYCEDD